MTGKTTRTDDLDTRLAAIDLAMLERFAAMGRDLVASPPFDNRFFNQFVNSPNFQKRLRRPELPAKT